jgi:guanidinopropionase
MSYSHPMPVAGDMVPRFADVATFMRLPRIDDPVAADVAIVGVPWDGGTTNRAGARHGPREIRNQSTMIRAVHPVTRKSPFQLCKAFDLGDAPVNPVDIEVTLKLVERFFAEIVAAKAIPLAAGGDHLVTLPILQALAREKCVGLIHFDAHSDTWDSYFGGSKYTHGTPFRRAIERNLIDPKRMIQIGIRGSLYDARDNEWALSQGIRIVTIEECRALGTEGVVAEVRRVVGDDPVYLTFDVDGLDPAYAPGTGTPEIGGFSTLEAQIFLRGLDGLDIVGADVVEVSPPFDPSGMTALVGATMMFEILCVIATSTARNKAK